MDTINNGVEGADLVKDSIIASDPSVPETVTGIMGDGLQFDGENDIAMAEEFQFPSTEFTLSFWIMSLSTDEGMVPLSYATAYEDNEFILEDPADLKIHIRGISKTTGIELNDGEWHHVVITWEFLTGALTVYKDMVEEFQGTLALGTEIRSGGTLVLGNEQDR